MDFTSIKRGLEGFVERYDSQTFLGSYRETTRSSLLKEGLSTRANSLWKMAEYVVAKLDDTNNPIEDYLNGWKQLASSWGNQFLLLEESKNSWKMFDSQCNLLGGNEYISDYLSKQVKMLNETEPMQWAYDSDKPLQLIYFGAPGTSKSTTIKREIGNAPQHRITFHPDTDYSNFVGCYKPTKEHDSSEITYTFVAQTFVKAYVEAWKNLVNDAITDKRVFLIIEEINRGNCAQIFGDLFQLLDRGGKGFSDYTIEPDADLQRYLDEEAFKECTNLPEEIRSGKLLRLPPNLYIWATMNTSDQSLFPIDSAFKRRWDWKYIPIKNDEKGHLISLKDRKYDWWEFLEAVNKRIEKVTESEDKQMGYWFAKPDKGIEITSEKFVSKVVFYLWNDVFKDYGYDVNSPFVIKQDDGKKTELRFKSFFDPNGNIDEEVLVMFFWGLKLNPKAAAPQTTTSEPEQEPGTTPDTPIEQENDVPEELNLFGSDDREEGAFDDREEDLPEAKSISEFFK